MNAEEVLVFDTGPLSHFAINNWLGPLKAVVGTRRALIPDVVVQELQTGAVRHSGVAAVLTAPWIEKYQLCSTDELAAFGRFSALLVKKDRNWGEAGVLALASTMGAVAIVDDRAARKAAETHKIKNRPTLALLCDAIRQGLLTPTLVSELADDLLSSEYRLPFPRGQFVTWATENGLI
ncbi:hypothetical protein Ssi03_52710 [Sphaerisporangium siamense]|uniref:Putative nucleic acid-binding protein n=1 Tax=Sphaerisporangium siamense TaxID=795645 RepID=A0A7W7GA49_9ACTN|nr:hypothetical protein [Sphaerisporangium siamense]MBB4701350.1 putative nucleic acid-binding protein [Sphaerisporangium siamense]GII87281.1 hypothetical protein Ssi03_52710 [Sphaerisporangium siamense]